MGFGSFDEGRNDDHNYVRLVETSYTFVAQGDFFFENTSFVKNSLLIQVVFGAGLAAQSNLWCAPLVMCDHLQL